MTRWLNLAALSASFVLALGTQAHAQVLEGQVSEGKAATRIEVRFQPPVQEDLPPLLIVRLTNPAGLGVSGASVGVYLDVTFFGGRSALLGRATTDASGDAFVPFRPDRSTYNVRAIFAGDASLAPSEKTETLTIPAANIAPVTDLAPSSPLAGLRRAAPQVIAGVVAALWVLLVAGFIWVLRRIHHHGSRAPLEATGR